MRVTRVPTALLLALTACEGPPEPVAVVSAAATVNPGFSDEPFVSGLSAPTAMAFAPDGRLFVCEQGGRLRVVKGGALLSAPFLTVPVSTTGERGLLGVAFDPAFASNQFVYVYYTATAPVVHSRVSRFTASGDLAIAGSETVLLELPALSAGNHIGGAVHFGLDDKLYVAVGENQSPANAQSMTTLLGKLLRLNADGSIPGDNPFFDSATGNNRAIWALGLRNPFTFAVQPGTGRIFINDVGQSAWEEINEGVAGANYGWPTSEGATSDPRFRTPLRAYNHSGACGIAGGAFYDPATVQFPSSYVGSYFYADYCGKLFNFVPGNGAVASFATQVSSPVDLKVGSDGLLYYLARGTGSVGRIRATSGSQPPQITSQPASRTVGVGQPATFTVTATGTAPLTYQWQRGGVAIAGATAASYMLAGATASDNGATFRVLVSNALGTATSNVATLTVTSNRAPTVTITAPAAGSTYRAGASVFIAGTGSDPEDGTLGGAAFTWQVDFHHDTHLHPFIPAGSGATTGTIVIPKTGETAANVFYRIHLTVRDSGGLTSSTFRDITPQTAAITLQTSPAGLQFTLDGQPVTTPWTVTSVVGMNRSLGVVSPQTSGGITYTFVSWSDGGAATHTIASPAANTTYTVTYRTLP